MARCGCTGASCSCLVQGSGAVTVTGTGSVASPYTVSANLNLVVTDSATVNLTSTGDGSPSSPWSISAAATLALDDLTDVITAGSTTGQVLARQADGTYQFVAATTAPTGAINLATSGGLSGDGSAGLPLSVKLAPSSGLTLTASGLSVTASAAWTSYTPTWSATTTNPALGNGSLVGAYSQAGKTVNFSIELITGSTTTRGVGRYTFALPVAPKGTRLHTIPVYLYVPGVANYVGTAKIEAGILYVVNIATSTASSGLSHSTPATLPAGSQLIMTGVYEAN